MLLSPEMGGLVTKMAQSMGCWANLGKNPYFEPFLWLNHPFLGLATFRKVDSLIKMSNFSFIKFSQKLGVLDLQNLVELLREPMLLNKVLCGESLQGRIEKQCASTAQHLDAGLSLSYSSLGEAELKLGGGSTCFFCAKHSHHALCQWVQGCHGADRN